MAKPKLCSCAAPAKQPRRQEEEGANKREERPDGDADEAQGQREKPDNREKDECQQRHWPAKHEQNAPTNKED